MLTHCRHRHLELLGVRLTIIAIIMKLSKLTDLTIVTPTHCDHSVANFASQSRLLSFFSRSPLSSMPSRAVTRKSCAQLPRYKGKATISQQVCALRRVIVWEESFRAATEYANAQSGALSKENVVTQTSLRRLYHSVPPRLQSPLHANEGELIAFIQQQQADKRALLNSSLSLLTQLEEELIVQWLVEMGKINLPIDRIRVIAEARRVVEQQRGKAPPGRMHKWYRSFRRRHPEVTERICQDISKQRITAQQNTANIDTYFHLLSSYRDLPPSQIYAGDETGLDGDGGRRPTVLAQGGAQRVTQQLDSYREHTSLMHIGNAAGESLPIIFIFKGKQIDQAVIPLLPSDALVGAQENGYFIGQHFLRVLQHLDRHGCQQRPLLFIIDGAKGHLDLAAIDFARSKQIHLLCLPAQTTHILQVADVSLFGPFKTYWRGACDELKKERARSKPSSERGIRRGDIVPLVLRAWPLAMTTGNIQAGFKRTGIYPYDPTAHMQTKEHRLKSLGGLPLLVSPSRTLSSIPVVAAITDLLPVQSLAPAQPNRCGHCGSSLKKKAVRRTLSTAAGVLLTGDEARHQIQESENRKKLEKEEKERRKTERAEKKRKRDEEAEEKGGKVRRSGKKKRAEEEEDKENAHPNMSAAAGSNAVRSLVLDPRITVFPMQVT